MNKIILLLVIVAYAYADVCVAWGDPHMTTFSGVAWEFQKEGDYVLLKNSEVTVQSRQRLWGATPTVITAIAIKFRGAKTFVMSSKDGKSATVDGKDVALNAQDGVLLNLGGDVSVSRKDGNKINLISKQTSIQIEVTTTPGSPQDHYYNLLITVPNGSNKQGWSGACVTANSVIPDSSVFTNKFVNHHHGPRPHLCTRDQEIKAENKCKKIGFQTEAHFKICVYDTCHGFSATKVRHFYDREQQKENLRDSDLKSLIERAERAVKYRKLMETELKIIHTLQRDYETYSIQFKKVRIQEQSKVREFHELQKLESEYRNKVTSYKKTELSYKAQLTSYRLTKKKYQQKLIFLRKEESDVKITITKIRTAIKTLKRQIVELTARISRVTISISKKDFRIQKIKENIKQLNIKVEKYLSYQSKFEKKLRQFQQERVSFEQKIQVIISKEQGVSSLLRELKSLNNEMFSLKALQSKHLNKKSTCQRKVAIFRQKDQEYQTVLRRYIEEITKIRVQIKTLQTEEYTVSTKRESLRKLKKLIYKDNYQT